MFNSNPKIQTINIGAQFECLLIDDALSDPQRWVALAAEHRESFAPAPFNAYPGIELRMPDALSARLDAYFSEHVRARLGARRTLRMYSRLAMVTRRIDELEPRQWICHRDRLDLAADRMVGASVLYLFKDASLGGTAFFRPLRSEHETALLIHESGALAAAEFRRKYGIEPSYPADSNSWFEKIAEIEPKWNRLVFYDGGGVFHASAIHTPKKLNADPASGRLTWNGFFICRRSMSGLDQPVTAA